jgi:hypothetical protein
VPDLFVAANLAEAVLWCGVAVIVLLKWRHWPAALLLIAFGLSDVVETQTGAWWRPWWLLAWKTACVLGLLVIVLTAWLNRRPLGDGPHEAGQHPPAG